MHPRRLLIFVIGLCSIIGSLRGQEVVNKEFQGFEDGPGKFVDIPARGRVWEVGNDSVEKSAIRSLPLPIDRIRGARILVDTDIMADHVSAKPLLWNGIKLMAHIEYPDGEEWPQADLMERKYGAAERIWAMDRGMVSEENLDYLRGKRALYIVGTPKARLKRFERELLENKHWQEVEPGVEVKLLACPDTEETERYVLCRSRARHEKEAAMLRGQQERLRTKLIQIDASLRKNPSPKPETIERRIGKWLGRNTAAEKIFTVEVLLEAGCAVGLRVTEDPAKLQWASAAHGAYLLRTNCTEEYPQKLWRWYIQLTEVEDAFRTGKGDLGLRPVYHQKEDRVQAHIFVCFMALAMWRSLECWLAAKGLGNTARQVIRELATIHSMDVVLPVRDHGQTRLRLVSKPETLAADLLARMGLKLPSRPKTIKNVVEKN